MNDIKYVAYIRKSRDSEDRQIQSLEDQRNEINKIAQSRDVKILKYFEESKTAKKPGRRVFNEMMTMIQEGQANGIICWKVNRLARNPIDGGQIQWMLQQEVLKSIVTSGKEYLPTDNVLEMSVEMGLANQFIRDLSKDVRRGMNSKLAKGWRPTLAPLGYINDKYGEKGDKKIFKDPERFDLVQRMWKEYLTGAYTVPALVKKVNEQWGLRTRKGKKLSYSSAYKVFQNLFYCGQYWFNEELHEGQHDAMVSKEEFDIVQMLLGKKGKPRSDEKSKPFNGIIQCPCGAMVTYDPKIKILKSTKETKVYRYHHCTRRKHVKRCKQPSVTHEKLKEQIEKCLDSITIPEEFLTWALKTLKQQNKLEQKDRNKILENLHKEHQNCVKRIDNLINLYISPGNAIKELLNEEEFKSQKKLLMEEKFRLESEIRKLEERVDEWLELTEKTFNFATYAKIWFEKGDFEAKTNILRALGQNFLLKDGKLSLELYKPFLIIKETKKKAPIENLRFELGQSTMNKEKSHALQRFITIWSG